VLRCVLISRTENPTTTNRLEIGASNSEREDPPAATCLPRPVVVRSFHPGSASQTHRLNAAGTPRTDTTSPVAVHPSAGHRLRSCLTHFSASDKVADFYRRRKTDTGRTPAARTVSKDYQMTNSRCSHEMVVIAARASSCNRRHAAVPCVAQRSHQMSSNFFISCRHQSRRIQATLMSLPATVYVKSPPTSLVYIVRRAALTDMNPRSLARSSH